MADTYLNRRDFVKMMGLGAASLVVPGCTRGTAQMPTPNPDYKPKL